MRNSVEQVLKVLEKSPEQRDFADLIKRYRNALRRIPEKPGPSYDETEFRMRISLGCSLKSVGALDESNQVLSDTLACLRGWIRRHKSKSSGLRILLIENLKELADLREREGSIPEAMEFLKSADNTLIALNSDVENHGLSVSP